MFVCIYQQRKWFYYIMLVIINNVNLISSDADKCGDLPNPAHTKPLRDQSPPFEVGTKLTFDCKIGFVDSGIKSTAECILENNNAVWDIKSTCIGVTCGYPGDIENGQRIGDIFRFPENITYICNPGYKIRGRAVSYCGTDGQWTDPPPKCIIKSCPNPQSPLNGHAAFTVTTYKSEVHYTCRKGFILSGPSKRLCQENEQWDGSEPTCIEVTCPEPLNVPGGYFISIKRGSAGSGKYIDGDIIYYYCNNSAKNVLVRCTNGNWIGMLPECDVDPSFTTISITTKQTTEKPTDIPGTQDISMECQNIPKIEHGSYTEERDKSITYKCEKGYRLSGSKTLKCLSGKWNSKAPTCETGLPIGYILGIVFGIVALILIIIGASLYFVKKRKSQSPIKPTKASLSDAVNFEELQKLEKNHRPIPVTVL